MRGYILEVPGWSTVTFVARNILEQPPRPKEEPIAWSPRVVGKKKGFQMVEKPWNIWDKYLVDMGYIFGGGDRSDKSSLMMCGIILPNRFGDFSSNHAPGIVRNQHPLVICSLKMAIFHSYVTNYQPSFHGMTGFATSTGDLLSNSNVVWKKNALDVSCETLTLPCCQWWLGIKPPLEIAESRDGGAIRYRWNDRVVG